MLIKVCGKLVQTVVKRLGTSLPFIWTIIVEIEQLPPVYKGC